jgi:hypothetical protein
MQETVLTCQLPGRDSINEVQVQESAFIIRNSAECLDRYEFKLLSDIPCKLESGDLWPARKRVR